MYDSANRKVVEKVIGSDGLAVGLTQYSYDNMGRLECTAVRMNVSQFTDLPASACEQDAEGSIPDRITKTIYDAAGQVLQVREGVGSDVEAAEVTYKYDAAGKIEYLIDANGNRTTYEYDGFDRMVRWNFPDKAGAASFDDTDHATALASAGASAMQGTANPDYEEYTYDANGNRTSLRKRDGSVISYTYDALNRMTSKQLPTMASGARPELAWQFRRDVHYTYDLRGLQTSVRFDNTGGQGILTQYDGFGRITQTTNTIDGKNHVIGSTYDAHGNRTSVTHPDGTTFAYAYDGLDRLDYIADPTGAWIANPIYNDKGQLGSIYRNGNAIDTVFKYDTVGRLNSLRFLDVVSSSQVRWDYTRNPASQIITETRDNDAYAWLVENSFERDYTTNGLNQYEAAGSASFCYDANGNLTSDGAYVYLYDFENRLVQMRLAVNADCAALDYSGAWRATFNYDTLGRLRIVNEGPNSTRLVHDGEALIVEYDGSDNLLRRYVHGTNAEADDPLVWYEGAGTARADRRYLHADPRGSIVLTADADGNTIAINAYDEYGIPTTSNNGFDITTRGRFRYTGQVWLPELGMYYYKARIYSPTLGRFMQTDPIGYEDQFNLYAYVANDPINGVDPTGMTCELVDEEYACQIDRNNGNFSKGDIDALTQAYTATVNYLAKLGDDEVELSVGGEKTTISASELVESLSSATIDTRQVGQNAPGYASTVGGALTPRSPLYGGAQITINSNFKEGARSYGRLLGGKNATGKGAIYIFAHEGAHASRKIDQPFSAIYQRDPDRFNQVLHGRPYFNSIRKLLQW